jgi:hypothetical protein
MGNNIQYFEIIEGNLKAEKDTGDFGGPNMWKLFVKTTKGRWKNIQWMGVYSIQELFNAKLPVYEEQTQSETKYKLAQ